MNGSSAAEICNRKVATVETNATPVEAAARLAELGIGCLVVVEPDGSVAGMITDRDLALRVVGENKDGGQVTLRSVMTSPVVQVEETAPLDSVYEAMRSSGVRRVVVTREGALAGIVAMDDLLQALALEMEELGNETRTRISRGALARAHRDIDLGLEDVSRRLRATSWLAREELLRDIDSLRERVKKASAAD